MDGAKDNMEKKFNKKLDIISKEFENTLSEKAPMSDINENIVLSLPENDRELFFAIHDNDATRVKAAIRNGAKVNRQDANFITPLISAISLKNANLVDLLIENGADVNLPDPETNNPPLAYSLFESSPEIAKILLDHGADPLWRPPGETEWKLMRFARQSKKPELVELLKAASNKRPQAPGPEESAHITQKGEPLTDAQVQTLAKGLSSGKAAEMGKTMMKVAEASLADQLSPAQWQMLRASVESGLVKSGFSREELAKTTEKMDVIWHENYAFNAENPDASESDRNDFGSMFDRAAAHGNNEQVEFWSKAVGPDFNPDGLSTPLIWSIYGGRTDTAQLLLDMGSDPNGSIGKDNETSGFDVNFDAPLHIALTSDKIDIALSLLKAGARATGTDRSSLEAARQLIDDEQRRDVVDSLSQHLNSESLHESARAVGALGALVANNWVNDDELGELLPIAKTAREKHGLAFEEASRIELDSISHLEIEFDAVIKARSEPQTFAGSILDKAAACGELGTLRFFGACAGGDWNPDGGDRPIDWAANVGDAQAIRALAESGSPLEAYSSEDGTSIPPLARAISNGWPEAAIALLELGADPAQLTPVELEAGRKTLSTSDIESIGFQALEHIRNESPDISYFGIRQIWNLAKVGWAPDLTESMKALDSIGFAPHLMDAGNGRTQAAESILREEGYLAVSAGAGHMLGGEMNYLAKFAYEGNLPAVEFFSKALGADFRHDGDNGSALANAVANSQTETARTLIANNASMDSDPDLLGIAAARQDAGMFLMLASQGASPDKMTDAERQSIGKSLQPKGFQQALCAIIPSLPADQDGFDEFIAPGTLPSSLMANLIKAGQKERFWNNRERIDWTRDVSSVVEAATVDGEAGLAAYAKFRRSLAADDIQSARECVDHSPSLLASLSKRGLVDEAILAALGAGRSSLMTSMANSGWPMESTMRAHAAEALCQAANSKDQAMFEQLLPMAPADGTLDTEAQSAIARAAWKLGGSALLSRFDEQIGGLAPSAIENCRDLFQGSEGEKAFSQIALAGLEREGSRSRALDKQTERTSRRKALFVLSSSHWSSFSEEQKLRAAKAVASWNEPGFWERAEKTLAQFDPTAKGGNNPDGPEAFYVFCFSTRAIAGSIFSSCKEELLKPLAQAAQMAAACYDSPELASIATVETGIPSSESAILRSAKLGHDQALKGLLSRVEGQTMKGFFSRALIPGQSADFLAPVLPEFELPSSCIRDLVEAGASFSPKDLEGQGAAAMANLAQACKDGKISKQRELSFSKLCILGAIPVEAWMTKTEALAREPQLLAHANDADKNDPQLVKAAVESDGMALKHASPLARATLGLAMAACKQTPDAFHCIHPALISNFSLTENTCVEKLAKALDDKDSIIRFLAKKSVVNAENSAQNQAKSEMEAAAKARALDFVPLERAIADAKLRDQERAGAEMALAKARAIRQAFERAGTVSNLDLADLRRVIEKNLPDLINRYAATDPAGRDNYDPDSRSTPNAMLKSALKDAMTTMEGIGNRADEGARLSLKGEAVLMGTKAAGMGILIARRKEESDQVALEAQAASDPAKPALERFGNNVDAAGRAAEPESESRFKPRM